MLIQQNNVGTYTVYLRYMNSRAYWVSFNFLGATMGLVETLLFFAVIGGFLALVWNYTPGFQGPPKPKPPTPEELYRADPLSKEAQARLLATLKLLSYLPTEALYNLALDTVAANPQNIGAKTFALELGRWHYARGRKDKKPTVYDEAAIQNDIQTRLG